jgi:AbrB family looped-hinge helix DNA binding protein
MIVKITSKRQVTFPKRVMERLRLKAGDTLSLQEVSEGILVRPRRFDLASLAPLRGKIGKSLPPPDYDQIRHAALDPRLRD